jgi:hypothetical protein
MTRKQGAVLGDKTPSAIVFFGRIETSDVHALTLPSSMPVIFSATLGRIAK